MLYRHSHVNDGEKQAQPTAGDAEGDDMLSKDETSFLTVGFASRGFYFSNPIPLLYLPVSFLLVCHLRQVLLNISSVIRVCNSCTAASSENQFDK